MQKLGFPALKSLDQLRSFKTPLSGAGKASPIVIPSPPPADSINYGSFATLKRTAGLSLFLFWLKTFFFAHCPLKIFCFMNVSVFICVVFQRS